MKKIAIKSNKWKLSVLPYECKLKSFNFITTEEIHKKNINVDNRTKIE